MQPQQWMVAGVPVKGYVWAAAQPRANVLLTHGYGEYAGRYVERYHALIPTLVAAGFTVYAQDQRGHGTSSGRRAVVDVNELVEDHLKAREALRDQRPPLFLFGHSMGGLVSVASALRDPRGLQGVVLSSPALLVGEDQPSWLKRVAPLLGRFLPGLPAFDLGTGGLSRLAEEVAAYESDDGMYHGKVPIRTAATMLSQAASMWPLYSRWSLPTLVLHGTQDKLADPLGSQRFFDTIQSTDKTLVLEDGGYHELLNDEPRDKFRELILAWLRARAQD